MNADAPPALALAESLTEAHEAAHSLSNGTAYVAQLDGRGRVLSGEDPASSATTGSGATSPTTQYGVGVYAQLVGEDCVALYCITRPTPA